MARVAWVVWWPLLCKLYRVFAVAPARIATGSKRRSEVVFARASWPMLIFLAWNAKAESEAPRGEAFYNNLADALRTDDITHWTHLQPMCGMQVPADPFGL